MKAENDGGEGGGGGGGESGELEDGACCDIAEGGDVGDGCEVRGKCSVCIEGGASGEVLTVMEDEGRGDGGGGEIGGGDGSGVDSSGGGGG